MFPTHDLAKTALFQLRSEGLPMQERATLAYRRAQAVAQAYALAPRDLLKLSSKFWQLHTDPIWTMDGAAATLCTIQYNLCAGTIAFHAKSRPDLSSVLDKVLSFDFSGQFCLTEVGHGLNVMHMETTCTLMDDGSYELNTPCERAAKYMPPTAPVGYPCVAVVFARAIYGQEDRGVKPFVVSIHDGHVMNPGVVCKLLPQRGGSRPVNHSLTYFHRVRLPATALLGSDERPKDARLAFLNNIQRVTVGTISVGSLGLPVLRVSSCIAARYSMRRTVVDARGRRHPIMSFRTQKVPILIALAQTFVMKSLHDFAVEIFTDSTGDPRVRHGIASILKTVLVQHVQTALLTLGDRCGAQGLFEVNQLTGMFADMRGTAIAEGDLLAISIRLASELLLGRYAMPEIQNKDGLLAKREMGLFKELRRHLSTMDDHRGEEFDRLILPHCQPLVEAMGHRMAYEAAVRDRVEPYILDLYTASCMKLDPAWYLENLSISRAAQMEMADAAIDTFLPHAIKIVEEMSAELSPYITAPIISDEQWDSYVGSLETFGQPRPFGAKEGVEDSLKVNGNDKLCGPAFPSTC